MGNKINPFTFRLGVNKQPSVRWYANYKDYGQLLGEDDVIRKIVLGEVKDSGVAKIEIERAAHNVNVTIHAAKPGVVIGRGGETIKKMRQKLDGKVKGVISVNVQEIQNPNTNATLIAQRIAEQLERRFAFKRAMKQAVQRTMEFGAKGVKIRCSGRLGGAEQARGEGYMEGRVPLHTLRADIDYGTARANTQYGVIGVKTWVFNGEIIGDKQRKAAVLPRNKGPEDDKAKRRRPKGSRPPRRRSDGAPTGGNNYRSSDRGPSSDRGSDRSGDRSADRGGSADRTPRSRPERRG